MIWVSCHGATPADQEYMGPVRYRFKQGYPGYFFPYYNQQLYLRYGKFMKTSRAFIKVLLKTEKAK